MTCLCRHTKSGEGGKSLYFLCLVALENVNDLIFIWLRSIDLLDKKCPGTFLCWPPEEKGKYYLRPGRFIGNETFSL